MTSRRLGIVAALAFVATVWLANWAVKRWGVVSVGFGLEAPAGVWFAGLAFTLRDAVHKNLGRWAVGAAIVVGAILSYTVEANATLPGSHASLAVASGLAFLFSEFADLTVYEPVRRRGWLPAVVASNVVGIVIDSALFLWLAFGSLTFFWGQVVGKGWLTLAAVLVLVAWDRNRKVVPV